MQSTVADHAHARDHVTSLERSSDHDLESLAARHSDFAHHTGEDVTDPRKAQTRAGDHSDQEQSMQDEDVGLKQDTNQDRSPASPSHGDSATTIPLRPKPVLTRLVVDDQGQHRVHTSATLIGSSMIPTGSGDCSKCTDTNLSCSIHSELPQPLGYVNSDGTPMTPDPDDVASLAAKDSLTRMFLGDPYEDRSSFVLVNVSLDMSQVSEVNDPMGFFEEEEALLQ